MKVLNYLIRKAREGGYILGFMLSRGGGEEMEVSNLLFFMTHLTLVMLFKRKYLVRVFTRFEAI